jgi:hypothetical protein
MELAEHVSGDAHLVGSRWHGQVFTLPGESTCFDVSEEIVAALSDPALAERRARTDSRPDVGGFAVEFGKHLTTRGVSPTVKD